MMRAPAVRRTIARDVGPVGGIGVRSGRQIEVRLAPVEAGHGLRLRRTDLGIETPVHLDYAVDASNCTAIGTGGNDATLFMEHLLACLHVHGITDLGIEVNGPELPLLDGSALRWHELIVDAGTRRLSGEVFPVTVSDTTIVGDDRRWVRAEAGPRLFCYDLRYDHAMIGHQLASFRPEPDRFGGELAPARTFAPVEQIEQDRKAGLIKGGSTANCLIVYDDHYSEPPKLSNEFARHKILDMLGDLYLLGRPVYGQIAGYRTGHPENRQLLRKLAKAG